MLFVAGHTSSSTAGVVRLQELLPEAVAGAVEVAEVGLTTMSVVSELPALSVTVRRTVPKPHEGAVIVALALLAFWMVSACVPTLVQEYELIERLLAAALPEALSAKD